MSTAQQIASAPSADANTAGRPAIRVLIVDDHAIVRTGIRSLLEWEDGIEPVGEAGSAEEAVAAAAATRPDVILLDVAMPDSSGIDALPALRAAAPASRALMVTMQDDPSYARAALAAGALGYTLKDAGVAELASAIRSVADGRAYVHPRVSARLALGSRRLVADDNLSPREREVLGLLARGYTNHEIAARLSVSVRTVESHRSHIVTKLGIGTRAGLVHYALETGMLRPDGNAD
ncbi:MAG TPA: response regulator transcription factor [Gaiellales bacterium]|nr:response regulator transcription factor [Gaiellales bacterium]